MSLRRSLGLVALLLVTGALVYGLQRQFQGLPAVATVLDPVDGLYRTARTARVEADSTTLRLPGLDHEVIIVRDARHVPHIYAKSDRDATIALGYVAAQDRLFQLDFIPRVASGRLAAAFGPQAIRSDRFLRRTGMEWGAQRTLDEIRARDDVQWDALRWYGMGVNAYLDDTPPGNLPLEFRLLGYSPDRYTPVQGIRLLKYMSYDLTYQSDDPAYSRLRRRLDSAAYRTLYPRYPSDLSIPIIPDDEQLTAETRGRSTARREGNRDLTVADVRGAVQTRREGREALQTLTGMRDAPGKGSNNWAVQGRRSRTGAPLLAGDMHLSLSLPSIWYEVHVVTPTMNAYGLTIPGAPVLIQAFNEHVGWTMTNTAADQIDHLALTVDSSRSNYRYEGEWRTLRREVDTIEVNGGASVLDTVYFSHHGPVRFSDTGKTRAIAERWVAHRPSSTLRALWEMNRADSAGEVREALQHWDTPMQNILYAGTEGTIAIRSAGHLPVRRAGHGRGLLDGSTDAYEWVGRVPFDSLPAARNPRQDYLASANQVPTGPEYPYYLGHDWQDGYRSLRINALLGDTSSHSVADFKRYQADVEVQQRDVFVPFLASVDDVSPRADTIRQMLRRWNGEATVDRPEPLMMDVFLRTLRRMTWDESVFATAPDPEDAPLLALLRSNPTSEWLDLQSTPETEDAEALLRTVLESTTDSLVSEYGWPPSEWRWGTHHKLLLRHLSGSKTLRPLWRGPYEYPGFEATLSPARGRTVTHSASQRVIIDFSTTPPSGIGVYPGGQRGNPLDPSFYDTQLPTYLEFEYFDLQTPSTPWPMAREEVRSKRLLRPTE